MSIKYSEEVDEMVDHDEDIDNGDHAQLIVFNDDFNTFNWVIESFMDILEHTFEQAEQLSLLVHFKGKAIVKTATFEKLKPQKDALVDRGLSAVIEELVN